MRTVVHFLLSERLKRPPPIECKKVYGGKGVLSEDTTYGHKRGGLRGTLDFFLGFCHAGFTHRTVLSSLPFLNLLCGALGAVCGGGAN